MEEDVYALICPIILHQVDVIIEVIEPYKT